MCFSVTRRRRPMRQLYFVAQSILINPQDADKVMGAFRKLLRIAHAGHATDEPTKEALRRAGELVEADRIFEALKVIRTLFEPEERSVAPARRRGPGRLTGRLTMNVTSVSSPIATRAGRRRGRVDRHGNLQQLPEASDGPDEESGSDRADEVDRVHGPARDLLPGRADGAEQRQARCAARRRRLCPRPTA